MCLFVVGSVVGQARLVCVAFVIWRKYFSFRFGWVGWMDGGMAIRRITFNMFNTYSVLD